MNKTDNCGGMQTQKNPTCEIQEHYKRFWTMLLHQGVWNDDRYVVMKADAMSRDPRWQRYDWHKRDIMPKCVVSLVRHWFPNPGGFPYGTYVGIRHNFGIIVL